MPEKRLIKHALTIIISFVFVMGAAVFAIEIESKKVMNIQRITLWQAIELLGSLPSFSPEKIRQVLPVDLIERYRTKYTLAYEGGRINLSDHIEIKTIDLRIGIEEKMNSLMVLEINGTCVNFNDVITHYPDIDFGDAPHGDSVDEETFWSVQKSWGQLSFGFAAYNPECLSSVVIDRTDQDSAPSI